jgi:hypothetical protein
MTAVEFYLGTHHPAWLARLDVPLLVSHRRLCDSQRLPLARALGSGGITDRLFGAALRARAATPFQDASALPIESVGPTCLLIGDRAAEFRAGKVRAAEVRAAEVRAEKERAGEFRIAEVRVGDVRGAEVRGAEVRAVQVCGMEDRVTKACAPEVRGGKVRAGKVRAAEVRAGKVREVPQRSWRQLAA